jgi:hypothetical protein
MVTLLNYLSVRHYSDIVSCHDCCELVRNDQGRFTSRHTVEGILNNFLCTRLQRASCFVAQQDFRNRDNAPCDGNPLPLPATQPTRALTELCIIALGLLFDELMCVGNHTCLLDQLHLTLLGQVQLLANQAFSDILKDCALKEGRLLLHESDIAPQPIRIEVGNVVAVQENLSSSGLIPSLQ